MGQKRFNVRLLPKADTYENFMAKNAVYLENELIFARKENDNVDIYLGDGVSTFSELKPVFSSSWIFGKNEVNLFPVQIEVSDWVDGIASKAVPGVLQNEAEQIVLPAWAAQSREIAQSCGISFIVRQDGILDFTCNVVPTETVICYIGIFGKLTEDENENQPYLRTDIDQVLSSTSTNPVENRVITNKIDQIEASIRGITGGGEGGDSDASLPAIVDKLNNVANYPTTAVPVGKYVNDEALSKITLTFTDIVISRETMKEDSDIASFDIGKTISISTLASARWAGKTDSGEFFSGCNIYIDATGKVYITGLPVADSAYKFTGSVTLEYIA